MEKINNVVKSSTAPDDVHALWLNPDDNSLRAFDFRNGWVSISGGGGEFPTDYARQGDNPDATLSATQAAVNSLSPIVGAAAAYNVGKQVLAANLRDKGVPATKDEPLDELAKKVTSISQTSYNINGGELYAKQLFGSLTAPKYWNLYEVLMELLDDGLVPAWSETEQTGYGGIILCEYYKGYDSFAFDNQTTAGTGGGYVFSDDYRKWKAGLIPEFPIQTNDNTHYWDDATDGKGNRWIAFLFSGTSHNFMIGDTSRSPRSIYIGRSVGVIENTVAGRASEIVVPDGNVLGGLKNCQQNFGKRAIIRNIKEHTTGNMILNPGFESAYIHIKELSGGVVFYNTTTLSIPNNIMFYVEHATGGNLMGGNVGARYELSTIFLHASGSLYLQSSGGNNCLNLQRLEIIEVEELSLGLNGNTNPNSNILNYVSLSYKNNDKTKSVSLAGSNGYGWCRVSDLELKAGWCKPLAISQFSYLTEEKIYTHILQRLKQDEEDCGVGVTITLGATNLAKLTSQESIDLLDLLTNTYGYTFA